MTDLKAVQDRISSDDGSLFFSQLMLDFGTTTSLDVPEGTPFEHYANALAGAMALDAASPWWVGDLLVYGDEQFGEAATQAYDQVSMRPSTISNCKWVSSAYAKEDRFEELKWTHHKIATGLEYGIRQEALRYAISANLSTTQFVEYVDDLKDEGGTESDEVDKVEKVTKMLSFAVGPDDADEAEDVKLAAEAFITKELQRRDIDRLG